jgi:hypothetical protein
VQLPQPDPNAVPAALRRQLLLDSSIGIGVVPAAPTPKTPTSGVIREADDAM